MDRAKLKEHRTLLLLLGLLISLGPFSIDMYLPAFPEISKDFSVPVSRVELSLASFFIGLSIGQLIYGPITDRFGRKKPLYFGLTTYIIASIGCALAPNIESLIALRFMQALGSCAGMVITRAIVRDLFDHRDSARVFSTLVLVMGLAPILAPMVGGQVIRLAGWHSIFWIVTGIATICLLVLIKWLPETRGSNPDVKLRTAFKTYREILKDREFMRNALAGGLAQAGMFAYITGSPFVLIQLFGVAPEHYGWFFGSNAAGLILVSQLNSSLIHRFGPERVLRWSLQLITFFGLGLVVIAALGGGLTPIAICLFGFVSSIGIAFPNSTAGALAKQGQRAGAASALIGTIQFTLATCAAAAVSLFHAQTALPMALVIGTCAILALVSYTVLGITESQPVYELND